MGSRVTLSDIAKRAGVSKTTVSMVLSNKGGTTVRPETYERILAASRALGYQRKPQNTPATVRTGNIGYLIPEQFNTENEHIFIRRLYSGVLQAIKGQNFQAMQTVVNDEEFVPEQVRLGKFDGVIIHNQCNPEWVRRIADVVPVVWLNASHNLIAVDSCMPDNIEGIYQEVKHLYDLGHRRIAVFAGSELHQHSFERVQGYRQSMEALQLPVPNEYLALYDGHWQHNSEDMKAVMQEALANLLQLPEPPTAVVTPSDFDAALMMRTASSMGLSIPRDISITGYGNVAFCDYLTPGLTSVDQPLEAMGEYACRLLQERINGVERPITTLRLGVKLVIRDSTAPPPTITP